MGHHGCQTNGPTTIKKYGLHHRPRGQRRPRQLQWPKAIEPMDLAELLDPPTPADDPTNMPASKPTRQHVTEAKTNQDPQKQCHDRIVDIAFARAWSGHRRTKPNYLRPCLKHCNEQFWVGPRGRNLTASQIARLQGLVATDHWRPNSRRTTSEIIGNSMAICVAQKGPHTDHQSPQTQGSTNTITRPMAHRGRPTKART